MTYLCESVPKLCAERCPELTPNAEFICRTFTKLFGLLHSATLCMIVNKLLTDTDIEELCKYKHRLHN